MSALGDIRPLPPLTAPFFDPEDVAAELRRLDRWCVAHCTLVPGGGVKKDLVIAGRQPRRSDRWRAESNDPATWATFDAAVADATVRHFALAMSFGRETDLFFLDVDHAFGPDDVLLPGVVDLLERFNTRTESTISGQGLRVIGRGQLPERVRTLRLDGGCVVEPYPRAGPQFALISGRVIAGFETIRDCRDVLPSLTPTAKPRTTRKRTTMRGGEPPPVPLAPATLTDDEMTTVVSLVAPFWTPGRRNALTLGLTGYLLLQGVRPDQALAIIEALTRDDDERAERLTNARRTIERHERGEVIAGWSLLTDELGLSREQLRPLEQIGNAVWRAAHPLLVARSSVGEPVDLFAGMRGVADAEGAGEAEEEPPEWSDGFADADAETEATMRVVPPEDVCLEDFLAHLEAHKYLCRPTGGMWPAASVDAVVPPVVIGYDRTGHPVLQRASHWLDKHAPIHQLTWFPGAPEILEGRVLNQGGWVERPGYRAYNTYRPPTIVPGAAAQAGPWLEHVRRLYPDEATHLISWFAHRVQRPAEKINHGLLLGGMQGCGKDTILRPIREAVGPWNFQVASPPQIMGRFNNFVKAVVLLIPELYDAGDVDRFAFYEHMKPLLAAPPDMHRCDEKYLPEQQVPNVVGCVITSNQRIGLHLPAGDRRHFAAWSDANPTDRDTFPVDYFDELHHWLDHAGGHGHVAAYLRQVDLSTFSPTAPPAKTRWFWAIVDAARPTEEAELSAALDHLGGPPGGEETWPDAITIRDVVVASRRIGNGDFADWLEDRKNRKAIPHRLEGVDYVAIRNPDAQSGWWVVGKERVAVYARRALSRRDQLIAANDRRGRGSP